MQDCIFLKKKNLFYFLFSPIRIRYQEIRQDIYVCVFTGRKEHAGKPTVGTDP